MRIRYLLTALTISLIGSAHAETVYIDNYFLAKKLEEIAPNCIENRELDTECADLSSITSLYLDDNSLYEIRDEYFDQHTGNLYGLQYLTGLTDLTLMIVYASLDINSEYLPSGLESLSIGSDISPDAFDEFVEVSAYNLPNSIKKLSIEGGREPLYNFEVNVTLPEFLEELSANIYYESLGQLPSSLKKLTLGSTPDWYKYALPEGLEELTYRDQTFYYQGDNDYGFDETPEVQLPSGLKKFIIRDFIGENQSEEESIPLGEHFKLNENLETLEVHSSNYVGRLNLNENLTTLYFFSSGIPAPTLTNKIEHLTFYVCGYRTIPELPVNLKTLDLSGNFMNTLPSLPKGLVSLDLVRCTELTCLPVLPLSLETLNILSTRISCIPNETNTIKATPNRPLCSDDQFVCDADNADFIVGKVFYDLNKNNLLDEGDLPFHGAIITINDNLYVSTNAQGIFKYLLTEEGTYLLKAQSNHPHTTSVSPLSETVVYNENENLDTLIFLIQVENVHDLGIAASNTVARPGMETTVLAYVSNYAVADITDAVVKIKKPEDWSFEDAIPAGYTISNDTIIWKNIELSKLSKATFTLKTKLPATAQILGDEYTYETWAFSATADAKPENNYYKITDTITGSYDPNDKQVNISSIPPGYSEEQGFIYTIRFQNTGTDTAFTVQIVDTILAGLDPSSFVFLGASHPNHEYDITESGIIIVNFENILLPDSNVNAAGSQGMISFFIKPYYGLAEGTVFENRAAIYFDYNEPIITNTAIVEVVVPTGIRERNNFISKMYPNPAKNTTRVEWSESGKAYISLIDISGRLIYQSATLNQYQDISLSRVNAGMYFVKIDIGNRSSINKLIVE